MNEEEEVLVGISDSELDPPQPQEAPKPVPEAPSLSFEELCEIEEERIQKLEEHDPIVVVPEEDDVHSEYEA